MAHAVPLEAVQIEMQGHPSGVLLRTIVIGLTAFLTVVDLFATQAILPTLTRAYQVTPAAMGFAVNSSTMGMAVAGLVVSLFSQRINRRLGILISLSVLSIPTALLAVAPDLATFTALRYLNGTISDLATRRDEFASIIASGGADVLIKRLHERTETLLGK